jgi:hypothetical protein
MKKDLFVIVLTVLLVGCSKDAPFGNLEQLKEQFQGKYEVISSSSEDAVDLNMDGLTSTDLLSENPELAKSGLELRILDADKHLFEEKWPVENITVTDDRPFDPTSYRPSYHIMYALYINPSLCQFDNDCKSIHLLDDLQQHPTNTLIRIESISIEENGIIKVATIRKLFTMTGWVTTKIASRYKRYTMDT